jgi:hypothetical protein
MRGGAGGLRLGGGARRLEILQFPDLVFNIRVVIVIQVLRGVARILGLLNLQSETLQDPPLDKLPAARVDRVSDIRVQLHATSDLSGVLLRKKLRATVITVAGSVMVFPATAQATLRQLSAGHGHKRPLRTLDHFQITNDEVVVDGYATEGSKLVVGYRHELDTNFGYLHHQCSFQKTGLTASRGNLPGSELHPP